ncbi:MAG: hypothetical protein KKE73_11970 [Proteobacteria bacterium]|nr:hypothetical protein [Pseudomonadota bacterium]
MPVLGRKCSIWILCAVVIVPVIVTLLTAGRSGLYDDLLVLRTSALLAPLAKTVGPVLQDHLSRHESEISEGQRMRYGARVDTLNNYPANSLLVRLAETLPSWSIYQSNILSHSMLKLLAMLVLVLVAVRTPVSASALCLVLLASLCVWVLPQGHLLNPLGRSGFLWYQSPLRCTSIVLFMALLLRLGTMGAGGGPWPWLWITLLALLGISMNVGLAGVYLPPVLLAFGLRRLMFPGQGAAQPRMEVLSAVFLGAVFLACLGWWAFISFSGGTFRFGSQRWFLFFYWLVCTLAVARFWLRLRPGVGSQSPVQQGLGDLLLALVLIFAFLILGLNWIQADRAWMHGGLLPFLLVELGTRSTGPANGVFLLLVAVMLPCLGLSRLRRYVTGAACVVLVVMPVKYGLVAYDNWEQTMDRRMLSLRLDDLGQGGEIYLSEKAFYAALSNELKASPDGGTVREFFMR